MQLSLSDCRMISLFLRLISGRGIRFVVIRHAFHAAACFFLFTQLLVFVFFPAALFLGFQHRFQFFHGRRTFHRRFELILVHYLVLEKETGDEMQFINVLFEDLLRRLIGVVDDLFDFRIDLGSGSSE